MSAGHQSAAGDDSRRALKPPDNGSTGLPGLRTWPRLYAFVLGCFVLWMALLFALEMALR